MKIDKILCPVDGSTAATNAVEYASELAKRKNAEIVLLEVIEVPTLQDILKTDTGASEQIAQLKDEALQELKSYCNVVEDQYGVRCSPRVKSTGSSVDREIKNEAEEEQYDLIIMGTNGADDVTQFFFGTHTYKVLKQLNRPLLMVPEQCSFEEFKQIVYATDYKDEDVSAARELIEFSKEFEPKLTFLHVSNEDNDLSKEVYRSFKEVFEEELNVPYINFQRIVEKDVMTGINSYMIRSKADLLVMLTRDYGFIEKLFHKSTTKNLSQLASYPVLIYHC